jgi:phosphopantothenate---cysteine ligase (ATP)
VVIGNDLHRRKFEVVFVWKDASGSTVGEGFKEEWLKLDEVKARDKENLDPQEADVEIEKWIVKRLVAMHDTWRSGM